MSNQGSECDDEPEDRIDQTTLNAALFFTVKPSELRLLSVLGSGGYANVYKADWSRSFAAGTSSIIVAVKQLHTDLGEVYRNRERLTMLTDHPNLVKCMDSTLEPPYLIVTEFLAGGSLFDLLYNCPDCELSLWQQVKILLDLKSSNILLSKPLRTSSQEPFAKVADFGLSRETNGAGAALTVQVGTWRWMAPEVFEPEEVDAKYNSKDIYSFGILMYEVLERRMPYSERFGADISDPRIGLYVCQGLRPTIKLKGTDHPVLSELIPLMQRAWDQDPELRPDFSELEEDLKRLWSTLGP